MISMEKPRSQNVSENVILDAPDFRPESGGVATIEWIWTSPDRPITAVMISGYKDLGRQTALPALPVRLGRKAAKCTQAQIARALRAAKETGSDNETALMPDGTIVIRQSVVSAFSSMQQPAKSLAAPRRFKL